MVVRILLEEMERIEESSALASKPVQFKGRILATLAALALTRKDRTL